MAHLKDERWLMYVVRCADRSLYCGVTVDLTRRLAQHNGELVGGGRYTRAHRPVVLVAQTCALPRRAALQLERWFKRMDAAEKRQWIAQVSPHGFLPVPIDPRSIQRELKRQLVAAR